MWVYSPAGEEPCTPRLSLVVVSEPSIDVLAVPLQDVSSDLYSSAESSSGHLAPLHLPEKEGARDPKQPSWRVIAGFIAHFSWQSSTLR